MTAFRLPGYLLLSSCFSRSPTLTLFIFPHSLTCSSIILLVFFFFAIKYNNPTSRNRNPRDKSKREGEFGTVCGGSFPPFPASLSPLQHTGVHINLSVTGRRATQSSVQNPNKQIQMWNICQVWADGVRSQNSLLINCN